MLFCVVSVYKVVIESCAGVLWMTDRHDGEVEVVDGMDCNGGGNRGLLPFLVRLPN